MNLATELPCIISYALKWIARKLQRGALTLQRLKFPLHSNSSTTRTIALHWFWCSCVGRQKHFHCRRQTLPTHGSVDRTQISIRLRILTQLAPNFTVGAKRFRYTKISFQPGYRCNMKCVVYIRKELCDHRLCPRTYRLFRGQMWRHTASYAPNRF